MKSTLVGLFALLALGKVGAHAPAVVPADAAEREALRADIAAEWQASQRVFGARVQVAAEAALPSVTAAAVANAAKAPATAKPFLAFSKLEVKWDGDFLYVGSSGWPDHPMMIGITNWQQQIPLPQSYFGANAWRIPLHPVAAEKPAMLEGRFLRGAVALAVNGIPIFNPQNNRGEVSYEIGELDQWGGHCGRADDYHYHVAPLHLQTVLGKGMPIAVALDGYPIYGLTEPDGSAVGALDVCAGHDLPGMGYHYHASMKRPYVMAGFHGRISEAGGQVDPQPRAEPVREALQPLRGARITDFRTLANNRYELSYSVSDIRRSIRYEIRKDGSFPFEFDDGDGRVTRETYASRRAGRSSRENLPDPVSSVSASTPTDAKNALDADGDGVVTAREFADSVRRGVDPRGGADAVARALARARDEFNKKDRNGDGKLEGAELSSSPQRGATAEGGFVLTSPAVNDGGSLPVEFTGDGEGVSPPLQWSGAPSATRAYAIIMDHLDPQGVTKSYWVIWDIPSTVTSIPRNAQNVGKAGVSFRGKQGYEPPHSKGPGLKTYVLHVYALSDALRISEPASSVNREALLAAMGGKILAAADLHVTYDRERSTATAPPTTPESPPMSEREGGQEKGARKPWMQMHGAEMDADKDGRLTMSEVLADSEKAWALYDANRDDVITPAEIDAAGDIRQGAAFAGLIYRHAIDLDTDNDSRLVPAELKAAAGYFFRMADADQDGTLTLEEIARSSNAPLPVPTAATSRERSSPPEAASGRPDQQGLIKAGMGDTVKLNVYADNWFMLYVNGRLVAVDPIDFLPHNVVSVDFLPEYPMSIAVLVKDNADPKTGMEYGNHIGDGGFILKFADGTVTDATWKARSFFKGPLNGDTTHPTVKEDPLPANWWTVGYNDRDWPNAKEYSEQEVKPKQPYYDADFAGAKFIWSDDLALDNTVIFRTRIEKPGWKPRWNTKPDMDVTGAPLR